MVGVIATFTVFLLRRLCVAQTQSKNAISTVATRTIRGQDIQSQLDGLHRPEATQRPNHALHFFTRITSPGSRAVKGLRKPPDDTRYSVGAAAQVLWHREYRRRQCVPPSMR